MSASDNNTEQQSDAPAPAQPKRERWPFWLGLLTLILTLAYILPGLTGHGPWKPYEAYSFGIVQHMVDSGDVVVPQVDGEPFMAQPPFFSMTAAGFLKLSELLPAPLTLPAHDAARLATALYLLILFAVTVLIGREAWSRTWTRKGVTEGQGMIALLVLLGTLGLVPYAHMLISDLGLSAGFAIALYGLVLSARRPGWAGVWLGTGTGLAFMSQGLLGPGVIAVTAVLLPLLGRYWRSRDYLRTLVIALIAALPWLLIWPALLYLRDPGLFQTWLWDNNVARFADLSFTREALRAPASGEFWQRTAVWMTFPAAALALLTLLVRWRDAFASPGVRVALLVSLVGWAVLVFSAAARAVYALPLLVPLAVIAAGGIRHLPGWLIRLAYLATVLAIAAGAALLWGLWTYHMFTGEPFQSPLLARYLPMDFAFVWQPIAYGIGAAFTVAWLWIIFRFRPPRPSALLAWPAGVVLLWGLLAMLHMPWMDAAKSYAGVFDELEAALPAQHGCVASLTAPATVEMPASERVLAEYFANIEVQRVDSPAATECDLLLVEVQQAAHPDGFDPGEDWKPLWQGHRPADTADLFMLFERAE